MLHIRVDVEVALVHKISLKKVKSMGDFELHDLISTLFVRSDRTVSTPCFASNLEWAMSLIPQSSGFNSSGNIERFNNALSEVLGCKVEEAWEKWATQCNNKSRALCEACVLCLQ